VDMSTVILWIRIFTVAAAICTTSVPIIYAFYPWRTRWLGRFFMGQACAFAFALDITVVFSFWRPKNIMIIFFVDMLLLLNIMVTTTGMAVFIWKLNHPRKGRHWRK
jgi:hypothetical protein